MSYPGQYPPNQQYPPRPQQQQYPGQFSQYPPPTQQYPPMQGQYPGQYPPPTQYPNQPYSQGPQQGFPNQYPPSTHYPPSQGFQQQPPPQNLGWGQQYYNMNSSQELQTLQLWFTSINRNGNGSITASELANANFGGQFSLGMKAANKLIAAFDKDRSGTIEFNEFAALHKFVSQMQQAFYAADANRNGFLDYREIYTALSGAGFLVSQQTVQSICQKLDKDRRGGVGLNDFILICAHLATVRSIFEWNDPNRKGSVTFNFDQLSHVTIHLMDD